MKSLLFQFAQYNAWANTRSVERLEQESDELLDQFVASSFPSLRATLLHIRNAEAIWTARLNGEPGSWPTEEDVAIGSLLKYSAGLVRSVDAMDAADLQEAVDYKDLRGGQHRQPRWQMLLHCFNHSTQHRGQLITMMRALGMEHIPANDLVVFHRSTFG